jgi:GTP-binding protein
MKILNSQFLISNTDPAKCPPPDVPEYAFIGRSNVGKSSLINALVQRKSLAKTSGKPGKTRLINHFVINRDETKNEAGWYLVDLPGYGYASVSKKERGKWSGFTEKYLRNRKNLQCIFVLVDLRIKPQKIDLDFVNWLGSEGIPFIILGTKADKLTRNKIDQSLAAFNKALSPTWENIPRIIVTSAQTGQGRDEVLDLIADVNSNYDPRPSFGQ